MECRELVRGQAELTVTISTADGKLGQQRSIWPYPRKILKTSILRAIHLGSPAFSGPFVFLFFENLILSVSNNAPILPRCPHIVKCIGANGLDRCFIKLIVLVCAKFVFVAGSLHMTLRFH